MNGLTNAFIDQKDKFRSKKVRSRKNRVVANKDHNIRPDLWIKL
jgi:hypothetical protein